jgi:hypothetical protein
MESGSRRGKARPIIDGGTYATHDRITEWHLQAATITVPVAVEKLLGNLLPLQAFLAFVAGVRNERCMVFSKVWIGTSRVGRRTRMEYYTGRS